MSQICLFRNLVILQYNYSNAHIPKTYLSSNSFIASSASLKIHFVKFQSDNCGLWLSSCAMTSTFYTFRPRTRQKRSQKDVYLPITGLAEFYQTFQTLVLGPACQFVDQHYQHKPLQTSNNIDT